MTTADMGAAGFWTMSRVVGFMGSRRGGRPMWADWALAARGTPFQVADGKGGGEGRGC
ncbi:MAG: hypothetical protein GY877_05245 [Hyphomicrobium sp.]|nr:hypothetical protein [Hyphomicrobium sp.]